MVVADSAALNGLSGAGLAVRSFSSAKHGLGATIGLRLLDINQQQPSFRAIRPAHQPLALPYLLDDFRHTALRLILVAYLVARLELLFNHGCCA